jgi:hypothetical protein
MGEERLSCSDLIVEELAAFPLLGVCSFDVEVHSIPVCFRV